MEHTKTVRLANWGNYPSAEVELSSPDSREALREQVLQAERLIARGNGRCYGDAALSPRVVSMLKFNRLLEFDAENGIVSCEAGLLLSELLPLVVPQGWFFHVTPGIKSITVGGAIASDVHGKNHPEKGCFSDWLLDFSLMQADGSVVYCSKSENADLFWLTCGGMGWTGIVLEARFQLMRLASGNMRQRNVRAGNLAGLLAAFDAHRDWPYAAAWVDCTAGGAHFGRGAVFFARHAEAENAKEALVFDEKPKRNVPFYAPGWFLNPLSIRLHNYFFHKAADKPDHSVTLDRYFYPLDAVQNWNRFYGRRGFIQYQCCIPENAALEGLSELLHRIKSSSDTPFLTVLKRHGARNPLAVNSFPIQGYSLALDFPRTRTVLSLVPALDAIVWKYGGKIYLTKDAASGPKMGRINASTLREPKFWSYLKGRITL